MILSPLQAALLPIWVPLLVAPMVYVLRRTGVLAALLATATMAFVAVWLLVRPPVVDLTLAGRTLLLTPLSQIVLIALAAWLAAAFLFAWRVAQGWSLYPFLLVSYALICAALLFEEFVLQVILLQVAWLVVILLVQGGTLVNTRAGTRLLVLVVLALPPFLIAASLIGQRIYFVDDPLLNVLIVLALGMGFALMLAIIPFHAWLPQVAEDAPPLVAAWLVAGMGSSYLVVLFDLLARYEWLAQNGQVQRLLFLGGIILAVGGGVLAASEHHLGRMWAYSVLMDSGYILLGLSFDSALGRNAAILIIVSRLASVLLAGAALAIIRHHATALEFEHLGGIAARLPVTLVAFALGSLAMLGIPLTAGFPGHWAILRLLMAQSSFWVLALLVAVVLGAIGYVRAFAVMTGPPALEASPVTHEPRFVALLLCFMIGLTLLLGVAPQITSPLLTFLNT